MDRHLCGTGWAGQQIETKPELGAIAAAWKTVDSSLGPRNHTEAETATKLIFSRIGLPAPRIRWWKSPLAMLLAHEIHCLGENATRALYGNEIAEVTPEIEIWRLEWRPEPLGRPVGIRACTCSGGLARARVTDCQRHRLLIGRRFEHAAVSSAELLAVASCPMSVSGRVEQLVRAAFNGALESCYRTERAFGRPVNRPVFDDSLTVWPSDIVGEICQGQFAAAIAGVEWEPNCLQPYKALISNCSLALLREGECWLADRPTALAVFDQEIHRERAPAVEYADGSRLFVNHGDLMPRCFAENPETIPLGSIDSPNLPPIRRERLIKLYGVQRYLNDVHAVVESRSGSAVLWRLGADRMHAKRMLQLFEKFRMRSPPGVTYYELPESISTLEEALEFAANPYDEHRLVIETCQLPSQS